MKPLTPGELKGTWCTLLLPINADNSIDYGSLENELDYLCAAGISGIYSNGTAGEFFNQTEAEFDRITLLLSEKCMKANIPFQIGASHMSPIISLERIQRSKVLSPGAFQVILPEWVAVNAAEQLSFLWKIAEVATPVPIVLYNPPNARIALNPSDLKKLAMEVEGLIGIKVAAGGPEWFEEMRSNHLGLSVFVTGHRLATGIKEGVASGAYSNVACINPVSAYRWYELMHDNLGEALRIEERILTFFTNYIFPLQKAGFSDMALDKFLAAIGGWSDMSTRLRWPYKGIDQNHVVPTRKMCQQILPGFFAIK